MNHPQEAIGRPCAAFRHDEGTRKGAVKALATLAPFLPQNPPMQGWSPSPERGDFVKIVFAGKEIVSYLAAYESKKISWPRVCPACGVGRLHCHGSYRRKAEADGLYILVPIQRMRCYHCKKTCSVLPSLFIPRHSMTTPERERVAAGVVRGSRSAA